MWNNVINAWWSIFFYPATDAPRFRKGMIAMLCICIATFGVTWLVWYLESRENKRHEYREANSHASGAGKCQEIDEK